MDIPIQIFSWLDLPLVLIIFFLEILLASDNAAALALIVKKLPEKRRKKALFAGLFSAFFLRAVGVIFTAYLIHLFWMQIIGGLYLVYLAWKYILNPKKHSDAFSPTSYWKAVICIELIDVLFAIDSILGAFAIASLYYPFDTLPSKLWVIYAGGVLGVFAVRLVTGKLIDILDKYKKLEQIIFLLIGWMGVKLLAEGSLFFIASNTLKHTLDIFFWIGTLLIILFAILQKPKSSKT